MRALNPPLFYPLLCFLLIGGAPNLSAQIILTIRAASEAVEGAGQSAMQSNEKSRQLSPGGAFSLAQDVPNPWDPRWFSPQGGGQKLAGAAGLEGFESGDSTPESFSLLASNVTNVLEITATGLLPEKLYQLLVASNVTGPYLPENDVIEALSSSYTWLTTNYGPIGFYQVQEIVSACPPSATITGPPVGAVIGGASNIFVYATASACSSNHLVRAVLFDNGNKVGWLVSSETNLTNIVFELPTTHMAYGEHVLRVMVQDDALPENGENGYVSYSDPVSVTVTNPVWFTTGSAIYDGDFFPVASDSVYVSWVTVLDDARFTTEVRDPAGNLIFQHDLDIEAGSVDEFDPLYFSAAPYFVDGNGNPTHAPDAYYDLTVTVTSIPPQGLAEPGQPIFQVVKRFYTEYQMPSTTNAEAIVAFQVTFNTNAASLGPQAVADMNSIRQTFSAAYSNPLPGGSSDAFPMNSTAQWAQFLSTLLDWQCRTLVYVGHGSENSIGLPGEGAPASLLRNRFGNMAPWNGGTNVQPYRAVMLLGCDTAKESGHIIEAFLGIKQTEPKSPMTRYTLFDFYRMTPRAALGFTGYKYVLHNIGGVVFPDQDLYRGADQLTTSWAERLPGGLFARDLAGAVQFSKFIRDNAGTATGVKNPAANKERIVGDDRINFQ